ncbi:ABC transporter permease [Megasphaera sueciensis]|jgi:peptide/nickel transport system permease protein|uniref:ABC transporter permease n=1 Tax=Megasphaera sueciensis TaxID=349094 RepID=UPI003CFED4F5
MTKEERLYLISSISDDLDCKKNIEKFFQPKRNWSLRIGIVVLFMVVVVAIFPSLFTSGDPTMQNMKELLQPPSIQHFFGTDNFGRDIYTRVIYGARVDLFIGVVASVVPFLLGSVIGLIGGYFGGWIDDILMRILDIMTAFPFIVLIIGIVTILGAGVANLFIAIWMVGWREYARLVRSEVLVEKNQDYVLAARVLGYSSLRVMFRHIMPNVLSSAIVYGVSDIMMCMLLAASMSFLGLGVQPPTPEWGAIISDGRSFMTNAWWISTFPGIALAITGSGLSLLGAGLASLMRQDS